MALYQVNSGDRILAADINQYYNILKGVAASGEAVTLIYNAAGVLAVIPSSDPAASTQFIQIKNAASTVKSAFTAGGGAVFSSQVNFSKGSDIASAGTTDLSTITGNYAQVSGTTTITAFGTVQAGTVMVLEFQGALTLTHNASSLILRSGASATTAAGDIYIFVSEGSGNWREISHLVTSVASGMTQISSQLLGSDTASITFSSIPGTYANLLLTLQGRGTTAATSVNCTMQFNADTGANYDLQILNATAGTPVGAEVLAATSIQLGVIAAANAPANVADSIRLDIANYAGTTFQKSFLATYSTKKGTTTGLFTTTMLSGWWRSTSAITSIVLAPSAGSFKTGTIATLYGLA